MIFKVIENAKPITKYPHQVVIDTLFLLRRQDVVIHQVTGTFFHIKKGAKVIGYACDQLMAIDKAFHLIKIPLPFSINHLVVKRDCELQEQRANTQWIQPKGSDQWLKIQ